MSHMLFLDSITITLIVIVCFFSYRYFIKHIHQTKHNLKIIIDTIAEGIITINNVGITLSFNHSAESIFGWKAQDIIGKHITILMIEQDKLNYINSTLTDQQDKINSLGHDVLALKKDGSYIPIYTTIEKLDSKGQEIYAIIASDTTFYKATERALQKREQQFRSIIANIPGCYVRLEANINRQVIFVSDGVTYLTGISPQEIIKDSNAYINCVNPEFIPLIDETLAKVLETKSVYTIEYKITHIDGTSLWVWETGRYVTDADGDWIDAVTLDITERRIKEERIKSSRDDAKKSAENTALFLANMSHEIRTPLNAVIGFTNLLAKTALDDVQQHYMESVNKAANALLLLLNNILDNIKLERGALDLENIDFSLKEVLKNSITLFRLKAQIKGIELSLDYSDKLKPFYKGDPLRISQIINNIISNAIKFTEAGKVVVKVYEENDQVHIAISDTGIGMSENHLKHIFMPFVQEDASMSRRFGGSGLGMTIVKQLTDLMQGKINIETVIGKGSTFHVLLPLHEGIRTKTTYQTIDYIIPPMNILTVDDVAHNLELLKILLERQGHHVFLANNGVEAVNIFKKLSFDVVLMDLQMPELDGLEATKIIRQYEKQNHLPSTPIFAVTANVLARERKSATLVGMNGFIKKPIDIDDLKRTLASVAQKETQIIQAVEPEPNAEVTTKKLIDLEKAVELWQDRNYLIESIHSFLLEILEEIQQFDLKDENITIFFERIHKIKGASGNLCLLQLYYYTLEIENFKNKPILSDLINAKEKLITITKASLAEITPLLSEIQTTDNQNLINDALKQPISKENRDLLLKMVDELLLGKIEGNHYQQVVDALNALGQNKMAKQFYEYINNFDYDLASQLLQTLLDN